MRSLCRKPDAFTIFRTGVMAENVGPRYVCEVWSPGKIIFMNYWQKGESKWPKIVVSAYKSKRLVQIFLISCMCIEVDSGLISSQTACRYRFSFWSYGLKGGLRNGQKFAISGYKSKGLVPTFFILCM